MLRYAIFESIKRFFILILALVTQLTTQDEHLDFPPSYFISPQDFIWGLEACIDCYQVNNGTDLLIEWVTDQSMVDIALLGSSCQGESYARSLSTVFLVHLYRYPLISVQ